MLFSRRRDYYRRIFAAYLTSHNSQLSFWHDTPEASPMISPNRLGEYYMPFLIKADYAGSFDDGKIPMLDYRGALGKQYNPIAIAQYGLGNLSHFLRTQDLARREKAICIADWLVKNLELNPRGLSVWNHHFDWEYRDTLRAPWYSALAQGQGISLLVRVHHLTHEPKYLDAARQAFACMTKTVPEGGVAFVDDSGDLWLEEYLVDPPTHILNGFIWALWGVYDFWLATSDPAAKQIFDRSIATLKANLHKYDTGFWSRYGSR
jgi:heparosan-N-sulfate-glucuronate 5-epimerase